MLLLVFIFFNLKAAIDTDKIDISVITREKSVTKIIVTYENCIKESVVYVPSNNVEKDYTEKISPWWKNVLTKIKQKCK